MKIALTPKRQHKHEELSEEKTQWLKEFLDRSGMTYINLGRKDHVHVGKVVGVSPCLQQQYLFWRLRDTLDIINGNKIVGLTNEEMSIVDKFDKKISFTKVHHFFKSQKHYILNKFIPEPS